MPEPFPEKLNQELYVKYHNFLMKNLEHDTFQFKNLARN